jgi:hypothetical protein
MIAAQTTVSSAQFLLPNCHSRNTYSSKGISLTKNLRLAEKISYTAIITGGICWIM